jgi:hypothetical protein
MNRTTKQFLSDERSNPATEGAPMSTKSKQNSDAPEGCAAMAGSAEEQWARSAASIANLMKITGVAELIIRRTTGDKYSFEITPEPPPPVEGERCPCGTLHPHCPDHSPLQNDQVDLTGDPGGPNSKKDVIAG